jgi:hypothetical protein
MVMEASHYGSLPRRPRTAKGHVAVGISRTRRDTRHQRTRCSPA